MKRLLFFVAAILLCTSMQAQIVSSRSVGINSKPDRPSQTEHYWRVGLNMMNFTGDDAEEDKKIGYNVSYGFLKPMGNFGMYWGMEFGLGSRGYKYEYEGFEEKLIAHNVQISPFTFGYRYGITEALKIDIHLGAFVSVDYTGKVKFEYEGEKEDISMGDWDDPAGLDMDWQRFDAGLNAGFGVWYNRFNLDFNFQRGFVEAIKNYKFYTNNFSIRLGVAF